MNPFNSEATWQGIDFVADNDQSLLFKINAIIYFLYLTPFKIDHVNNFDDYGLKVHFLNDIF